MPWLPGRRKEKIKEESKGKAFFRKPQINEAIPEHQMTDSKILESPQKASEVSRRDKAQKVVEDQRVKLHRFLPSGLTIWTVVGGECDLLIDCEPSGQRKSYCSCDDFHFRVLSGKVPECYHLVGAKLAIQQGMYSVVEFSDEELPGFLTALLKDMFSHIS